eukprot:GGOE01045689.1.p1 GENE.GGOE01045689.1~~GGOE01045689.1.p1  ORF type:complete len:305 (-),score=101.28 GGOE01045689.1:250-1164(-)
MEVDSKETDPFRIHLGEDIAGCGTQPRKLPEWVRFGAAVAAVLVDLLAIWIYPPTALVDKFVKSLESLTGGNTQVTMLLILFIFAVAHSTLVGLRAKGEETIGEWSFHFLFVLLSVPMSVLPIVYFINHRNDGVQLWNVREVPGMHSFVWLSNFFAFLVMYPTTFNVLEIAAGDKPKIYLWETGIIRITRRPRMVSQLLWCFGHTLWVGTSFTMLASIALLTHHVFGCWHSDRRLAAKYGDAFYEVKNRTSVFPFLAILEGRQRLPHNCWREFLQAPHFAIAVTTIATYFAHPLMQRYGNSLPW